MKSRATSYQATNGLRSKYKEIHLNINKRHGDCRDKWNEKTLVYINENFNTNNIKNMLNNTI